MTNDVFISYSHHDSSFATKLSSLLSKRYIRVWRDRIYLTRAGENFLVKIFEAIEQSKLFVLLASNNSLQSPNVQDEVNQALRSNKKILCFVIDDIQYFPDFYNRIKQIFHIVTLDLRNEYGALNKAFSDIKFQLNNRKIEKNQRKIVLEEKEKKEAEIERIGLRINFIVNFDKPHIANSEIADIDTNKKATFENLKRFIDLQVKNIENYKKTYGIELIKNVSNDVVLNKQKLLQILDEYNDACYESYSKKMSQVENEIITCFESKNFTPNYIDKLKSQQKQYFELLVVLGRKTPVELRYKNYKTLQDFVTKSLDLFANDKNFESKIKELEDLQNRLLNLIKHIQYSDPSLNTTEIYGQFKKYEKLFSSLRNKQRFALKANNFANPSDLEKEINSILAKKRIYNDKHERLISLEDQIDEAVALDKSVKEIEFLYSKYKNEINFISRKFNDISFLRLRYSDRMNDLENKINSAKNKAAFNYNLNALKELEKKYFNANKEHEIEYVYKNYVNLINNSRNKGFDFSKSSLKFYNEPKKMLEKRDKIIVSRLSDIEKQIYDELNNFRSEKHLKDSYNYYAKILKEYISRGINVKKMNLRYASDLQGLRKRIDAFIVQNKRSKRFNKRNY